MAKKGAEHPEMFWARVDKTDTCWLWKGMQQRGYGLYSTKAWSGFPTRLAHRIAWFLKQGYWPEQLNHKCRNRHCVNPSHMYEGNDSQNTLDAISDGTHFNYWAKLTRAQAELIRSIYASGRVSQRQLGLRFGVTQTNISLIVRRKTWGLVPKRD